MPPKLFLLNSASPLPWLLPFHPSIPVPRGSEESLLLSSQTSCTA